MTPSLTTSRLSLWPFIAGMVTQQHVGWLNDPEVVRYSEQRHKIHTLETQHEYLNKFPVGSCIWLIAITGNGEWALKPQHIGTITAYIDQPNLVANMGILIGEKDTWGKGYGSEAWDAVIGYLGDNAIRRIECGFMANNSKMRALAARSGMRFEGLRNEYFVWNNQAIDLEFWGMMWYDLYHDDRAAKSSGYQDVLGSPSPRSRWAW